MKVLTAKQLTLAYARHISSTLAKPIDVAQSWSSPKTAGLESSRSWQLMHQSCKDIRKGACTSSQNCQTRRSSHPPEQTIMQILGLAFGIEVFWVSRSDHTDSRRGSHLDTCFAQGLFQVLQPCPPREGRFDRPPREAQASSSEFRVSGNITASKRHDWFASHCFSACSRHCPSGTVVDSS